MERRLQELGVVVELKLALCVKPQRLQVLLPDMSA
jgi:hypothetical protein